MKVSIGDVSLWFDVHGQKLVADGPKLIERPTLVLLHGGPGFDHTYFKPKFSRYRRDRPSRGVRPRANGRSDPGAPSDGRWSSGATTSCVLRRTRHREACRHRQFVRRDGRDRVRGPTSRSTRASSCWTRRARVWTTRRCSPCSSAWAATAPPKSHGGSGAIPARRRWATMARSAFPCTPAAARWR